MSINKYFIIKFKILLQRNIYSKLNIIMEDLKIILLFKDINAHVSGIIKISKYYL